MFTEPALDYQAMFVTALAAVAAGKFKLGSEWPSWQQCEARSFVFPAPNLQTLEQDTDQALDFFEYHIPGVECVFACHENWDPLGLVLICVFVLAVGALLGLQQLRLRRGAKAYDALSCGAFRLAAARGDVRLMELLARKLTERRSSGKSSVRWTPDECAAEGFTPLHAAAAQGQADAAAWLLARGAAVSAVREDGWRDTPLHYAAASGCRDTCDVLLAYGADPGAANFAGITPASVAATAGHHVLAKHLAAVADAGAGTGIVTPGASGEVVGECNGCKEGQQPVPEPEEQAPLTTEERMLVQDAVARGFEGWGTQGTHPKHTVRVVRWLVVITYVFLVLYLVWRAMRTLAGSRDRPWPLIYRCGHACCTAAAGAGQGC